MTIIKKIIETSVGKDAKKSKLLNIVGGNDKWTVIVENNISFQ